MFARYLLDVFCSMFARSCKHPIT